MTDEVILKDKQFKDVNVEHEMKNSYLSYAMSVIVSRALPDVRDGLKPVHKVLFVRCGPCLCCMPL